MEKIVVKFKKSITTENNVTPSTTGNNVTPSTTFSNGKGSKTNAQTNPSENIEFSNRKDILSYPKNLEEVYKVMKEQFKYPDIKRELSPIHVSKCCYNGEAVSHSMLQKTINQWELDAFESNSPSEENNFRTRSCILGYTSPPYFMHKSYEMAKNDAEKKKRKRREKKKQNQDMMNNNKNVIEDEGIEDSSATVTMTPLEASQVMSQINNESPLTFDMQNDENGYLRDSRPSKIYAALEEIRSNKAKEATTSTTQAENSDQIYEMLQKLFEVAGTPNEIPLTVRNVKPTSIGKEDMKEVTNPTKTTIRKNGRFSSG